MASIVKAINPVKYARLAGLFYLLIAVMGIFSIGYMPSQVFVSGDAAATASNIISHRGLFIAGILAEVLVILFEVILTVMLLHMFKHVNSTIALIATYARIGMTIVMAANLFNYLLPLFISDGSDYLSVFNNEQLNTITLILIDAHQYGVYIWQFFFALHLFTLGYLVYKCGYYPKVLGILMLTGSFGYAGHSVMNIANLDTITLFISVLLGISVLGELGFTFWLLINGVNTDKLWEPDSFSKPHV